MSAADIIAFASLAISCVLCLAIGIGILAVLVFGRRLNRQLRRDRMSEYRLPAEALPQSRQCPQWINRATGRANQ